MVIVENTIVRLLKLKRLVEADYMVFCVTFYSQYKPLLLQESISFSFLFQKREAKMGIIECNLRAFKGITLSYQFYKLLTDISLN